LTFIGDDDTRIFPKYPKSQNPKIVLSFTVQRIEEAIKINGNYRVTSNA
jgi:hypothetical protein